MTLCMAAACQEKGELRIVSWADTRGETGWAGADTAYKYDYAVRPNWPVLMAGELSKAKEFAATCRSVLRAKDFTADNIYDKLNEAATVHKEKLTERLVRKRLGIPFNRFLTKGEKELTSEVRNRTWYAIEELDFGAGLIVFGFIQGVPHIFSIDGEGEVSRRENFVAIGTGCVTAQSVLYYREQHGGLSLKKTLYHLYEAFQMTYHSKAPSVGGISQIAVFAPGVADAVTVRLGMSTLMIHLDLSYQRYGPKNIADIPPLPDECFVEPEVGFKAVRKQACK